MAAKRLLICFGMLAFALASMRILHPQDICAPWVEFVVGALASCVYFTKRAATTDAPPKRHPRCKPAPASDAHARQRNRDQNIGAVAVARGTASPDDVRLATSRVLLPPSQRVDYAVHPFGFDPYTDTVPRSAIILCDPLAPSADVRWWRAFKTSVIDRYGGPLSFALACEVHPDLLDQDRWPYVDAGRNPPTDTDADSDNCNDARLHVVVGKIVGARCVTRGQFTLLGGIWQTHGYAVRQYSDGAVFEGMWDRGLWKRGYIYQPSIDRSPIVRSVIDGSFEKVDFEVTWHTWNSDGRSGRHVRLYGPPSARQEATPRNVWPDARHPVYCGGWTPTASHAVCICCFPNSDQYVQAVDADGVPTILYYYIHSTLHSRMITNCAWTIIKAQPGADYHGAVFYPSDTTSRQFDMMADYVLSGRSAKAFSPAQQAAFVDAIRAVKPT